MTDYYEAEVVIGIEDIALQELQQLQHIDTRSLSKWRDGFIRFRYAGKISALKSLRSITAIYQILQFDVPRPKALLGHQHLTRIVEQSSKIIQQDRFLSLNIGAAGSDSSVMQRIKQELSGQLKLIVDESDKADLYLRVIPNRKQSVWEVLIRLTPRPLSTRSWREENMPGALNATVAYAMTCVSPLQAGCVVNLCSGTGTILIEQALTSQNNHLLAIENNPEAIQKARTNMKTSQTLSRIQCIQADAMQSPLPAQSADLIYADLPFGQYIGSHDENTYLYPAILEDAYRIAKIGSNFLLITHEIQLIEAVLQHSKWHLVHTRKINLGGLHPRIFVLERK